MLEPMNLRGVFLDHGGIVLGDVLDIANGVVDLVDPLILRGRRRRDDLHQPLIEVKWSMMDDSAWPVSSTSWTPVPTCDALVEK
jgi:hypothetical protein